MSTNSNKSNPVKSHKPKSSIRTASAPSTPAKLAKAQAAKVKPANVSTNKNERVVFRPVLDNPLNILWPTLTTSIKDLILEALLEFLALPAPSSLISGDATSPDQSQSIAQWRLDEHARKRGRTHRTEEQRKESASIKLAAETAEDTEMAFEGPKRKAGLELPRAEGNKRRKGGNDPASISVPSAPGPSDAASSYIPSAPPIKETARARPAAQAKPAVLDYLTVGINEITRSMETRIRWSRWELGDDLALKIPPVAVDEKRKSGRSKSRAQGSQAKRGINSTSISDPVPVPASAPTLESIYPFLARSSPAPHPDTTPDFLLRPVADRPCWRFLPLPNAVPSSTLASVASTANTTVSEPIAPQIMPSKGIPLLDIIFVCRSDINPPSLVAHLPTMLAATNGLILAREKSMIKASARNGVNGGEKDDIVMRDEGEVDMIDRLSQPVLLIPLGEGAERKIAAVLALRRVAAVGISSEAPGISSLLQLITKYVEPLSAAWLIPQFLHPSSIVSTSAIAGTPATPSHSLIPTHIKHLRTIAPLDPRASHAAKKEAKVARKIRLKGGTVQEKRPDVYIAED